MKGDKEYIYIDGRKIDKSVYYDGPIKVTGRSIDEIDAFLEAEKQRMSEIKWTPDMIY